MFYRPHRKSLSDSMAECVEIDSTFDALEKHILSDIELAQCIYADQIYIRQYSKWPDERIGWAETLIVCARWRDTHNIYPIGFVDRWPITTKRKFSYLAKIRNDYRCSFIGGSGDG